MHKGLNRLDDLDTAFREKIKELLDKLTIPVCVVSGRRTMAQQDQLYAQGRTLPGKIVTNAKAGQSAHNFGLAVDLCPLDEKGNLDWNNSKGFAEIATCAEDMGLVSGAFFKSFVDKPHIESPSWRVVREAWRRGEIEIA